MEHDPRSVANELIRRAHQDGRPINNQQTLKLAYFCHAWMLAIHHRPLLNTAVEAWEYGPIIPEIYHSLRRHGGERIRRPISLDTYGVCEKTYDEQQTNIIDQVSEKYGYLPGRNLSTLANERGSPSHQVWKRWKRPAVIPDPIIEDYYAERLQQYLERIRRSEQTPEPARCRKSTAAALKGLIPRIRR